MKSSGTLIILDRDGVLNEMVVDPEHGTIDSPLHPAQVKLKTGAAQAVHQLNQWNIPVVICTNQPAAAKGKTTKENLQATHQRVLELLALEGGKVERSWICFHRAEDKCSCRKPEPGMLLEALATGSFDKKQSWMVGDGVTDVQAGQRAGVRTAFVGAKKTDILQTLIAHNAEPDLHVTQLLEFVAYLLQWKSNSD